jgi:hypothetical protein
MIGPADIIHRESHSMIGPVYQIGSRKYMPVHHAEPGGRIGIMGRIDIEGVIEYPG